MSRMTNAKSVDVLDNADSFEDKLNWILFKQEQDQRLWSDPEAKDENGEVLWYPGDDLYPYPYNRRSLTPDAGGYTQLVQGNVPRHIIEEFDVNVFHAPGMDYYDEITNRCADCEVWWGGEDPCFVCGEVREMPGAPKARMNRDHICDCPVCVHERENPGRGFRFITSEEAGARYGEVMSGDTVYQTVPAGSSRDPLAGAMSRNRVRAYLGLPPIEDLVEGSRAFNRESRAASITGRNIRTYTEEDVAYAMGMIRPMRDRFLREMGAAVRSAAPAMNRMGEEVRRLISENRIIAPSQPGELFIRRENEAWETLGRTAVEFDGDTLLGFDSETDSNGDILGISFRRASVVRPRRAGGSMFRQIIIDEWTASERATQIRSSGIIIPTEYNTEPEVPLPDRVFDTESTLSASLWRRFYGQDNYPGSEPATTRRRPRND